MNSDNDNQDIGLRLALLRKTLSRWLRSWFIGGDTHSYDELWCGDRYEA